MSDLDRTTVIDPARVARMASSRADGRRTTMYGRHRKGARVRAPRPERPVEPLMAAVMTMLAVLWLAGMAALVWLMPMSAPRAGVREAVSAVCVLAAVASAAPAWAYLARRTHNKPQEKNSLKEA